MDMRNSCVSRTKMLKCYIKYDPISSRGPDHDNLEPEIFPQLADCFKQFNHGRSSVEQRRAAGHFGFRYQVGANSGCLPDPFPACLLFRREDFGTGSEVRQALSRRHPECGSGASFQHSRVCATCT